MFSKRRKKEIDKLINSVTPIFNQLGFELHIDNSYYGEIHYLFISKNENSKLLFVIMYEEHSKDILLEYGISFPVIEKIYWQIHNKKKPDGTSFTLYVNSSRVVGITYHKYVRFKLTEHNLTFQVTAIKEIFNQYAMPYYEKFSSYNLLEKLFTIEELNSINFQGSIYDGLIYRAILNYFHKKKTLEGIINEAQINKILSEKDITEYKMALSKLPSCDFY